LNVTYSEVWGNGSLREQLIQIGNNAFSVHGDLDRFVEEKTREAQYLQSVLRAKADETGLEIGCGVGVHTRFLAARSRFLHAVDVSDRWLELFTRITEGVPNIRRTRSDFFPFLAAIPDASIDFAFSSSVFCHLHVYDIYLYFEELVRVLKPGGRFYVNFQNADHGDFGEFFMQYVEMYRRSGRSEPIYPGQMQFHSHAYFKRLGRRMGLRVRRERIAGSLSEILYVKGEGGWRRGLRALRRA
jgi:SAM-dependent methyltransferase